jgi:beta-xylosidase
VILLLVAAGVALILAAPLPQPANPVHAGDFPDPFIVRAADGYHAYASNGEGNIQQLRSRDLARWERMPDAMPQLPAWAAPGRTWAPSLLERGGKWVLYFSAQHAASARQCIGAAVAGEPSGPFVGGAAPLACADDADLGAIDPSPFVAADGTPYLLWSACCNGARILSQRLSADGLSAVEVPRALIRADQPWEAGIVEAPSMLKEGGRLVLLYSANRWQGRQYAIGLAECEGPSGPCRKPADAPWIQSAGDMAGPGGQEFFRDGWGRAWLAYHAWSAERASYSAGGVRSLRVERVEIRDGSPGPGGRTASVARKRPDSAGALPADPGRTPR